jgi:hypothetical protein
VAALQDAGQLRQLRVQTFAAIGWQLNTAQDTSDAIQAHKSVSSRGAPEFNMSAGAGVLAAGYEAELYGNDCRPMYCIVAHSTALYRTVVYDAVYCRSKRGCWLLSVNLRLQQCCTTLYRILPLYLHCTTLFLQEQAGLLA